VAEAMNPPPGCRHLRAGDRHQQLALPRWPPPSRWPSRISVDGPRTWAGEPGARADAAGVGAQRPRPPSAAPRIVTYESGAWWLGASVRMHAIAN
jgi:hypothetical protein